MNAACALSLYIYLYLAMFPFFQNSANDNAERWCGVDNNTNNEDRICHGTNDSKPSSKYESDISDDGSDVQPQPQHGAELMVVVAVVHMLFQE